MRVIQEAVPGVLVQEGDVAAVRLAAQNDDSQLVYLTYALVTLGPEEHVFPCSVLDDWGREMTGLSAYEWMYENGNHFPRAEIFAMGIEGDERQQFLREFELYARYPLYALPSRKSSITDAVRVRAMLRVDDTLSAPARTERPPEVTGPLSRARVSWWAVPPSYEGLGFLLEDAKAN